jgi:hypothetical protein
LGLIGECFWGAEMTAKYFLENHMMTKDDKGQFDPPPPEPQHKNFTTWSQLPEILLQG